jgi:hypothetical protein
VANKKAPSEGATKPDGSRSPYENSPLQNKVHSYPKGDVMPGRGGYPPRGNPKSGGYKDCPK